MMLRTRRVLMAVFPMEIVEIAGSEIMIQSCQQDTR